MTGKIGLIGGTGPEGKGLAVRFAQAGLDVVIGSRSVERGDEAAEEVSALAGKTVAGATNEDAARDADLIVLTVPYSGLADTLSSLAAAVDDKILVSAVVPLQFSKGRVSMLRVDDGSAAEEAQRLLPEARVVGAFHNLSASHLLDLSHDLDGDVIVCGDNPTAVKEVQELGETIQHLRSVNAGPLSSSHFIEGVTALLLSINRVHKTEAHVRIIGV